MIRDRIQFDHRRSIDFGVRRCQMQWNVRGERAQTETHAVSNASVAERYSVAIQQSARQLTDVLGWNWSERHPDVIDIEVSDIGPGAAGHAMIDLHEVPYLRLSCRRFAVDDDSECRRLGNLVLHEFVHLLQFGTDVWWSWPYHGSFGEHDPNFWLHEGVALATEALCGEGTADWYPWLWKWAVTPHAPFDSDASGTRAAPFLIYLAQRLGSQFLADVYSANNLSDAPRHGTELLDATIRRRAPDATLRFMFAEFCAAWMSEHTLWSHQATSIRRVVGDRAICDLISAGKVSAHAWRSDEWTLNHLSCRYFAIRDLIGSSFGTCKIAVVVAEPECIDSLSSIAILLSDDGTLLQQVMLRSTSTSLVGNVTIRDELCHLRIVVVNTAHGCGWALHDDIRFHIECSWSD